MTPAFRRPWLRLLIVLSLAGCGGGGSDTSTTGTSTPSSTTATGTSTFSTGSSSTTTTTTPAIVRLSGTATFDNVPNTTGVLAYASTTVKPIRAATVEVVSMTSDVLASSATDDNGKYVLQFPGNQMVKLRVRAESVKAGAGPQWDVSIRDNTADGSLYVLETSAFLVGSAAVSRDMHASSGWTGTSYSAAARFAGPFALMDTIYTAMKKAVTADASLVFPTLRVYWSPNNVPYYGDIALGQVGGTFFSPTNSGIGQIAVLGRQDLDTDEYDASVIAHEWGHYYQWAFSRDDSPGGSHSGDDRIDARLAFSEGWGNAWSGIALARSNYVDSYGLAQGEGFEMDLSTGLSSNPGWFRELSIQSVLWNLHKQVGFLPIHAAMTGALRTGPALTTIYSFFSSLDAVSTAGSAALSTLLTDQNIHATPADPFGASETNSGGLPVVPTALPLYVDAVVGTPVSACVSNVAGEWNKLGNHSYVKFNAPTAGSYAISVNGTAGTDPDFDLYESGLLATRATDGTTESLTKTLAAGVHVLSIVDYTNSGANTCFNVTIN